MANNVKEGKMQGPIAIDPEDAWIWSDRSWRRVKGGYLIVRERREEATAAGRNVRAFVSLHREVMRAPAGSEVDHRSGDTLDNRKCNLRICTTIQNSWNRRMRQDNTTGFRGVVIAKGGRKFAAQIGVRYGHRHLGTYETAAEAAVAYDLAAQEAFGAFARLNFPQECVA